MSDDQKPSRKSDYYESSEYYKKRYQKNRERYLARQNEYYKRTKGRLQRKDELLEFFEPDSFTLKRESRAAYQKAYYEKNKAHIRAQQAEYNERKRAEKAAARQSKNDAGNGVNEAEKGSI